MGYYKLFVPHTISKVTYKLFIDLAPLQAVPLVEPLRSLTPLIQAVPRMYIVCQVVQLYWTSPNLFAGTPTSVNHQSTSLSRLLSEDQTSSQFPPAAPCRRPAGIRISEPDPATAQFQAKILQNEVQVRNTKSAVRKPLTKQNFPFLSVKNVGHLTAPAGDHQFLSRFH